MSFFGNPRSVSFNIADGNTGAAFYPGGFLDDPGVNNNVWVASGVIVGIYATLKATTSPAPGILVWDFISDLTGKALGDIRTYLLGGVAGIAGLYNGINPATGAAWGAPPFEAFNAPAAGDGRAAYVAANARNVGRFDLADALYHKVLEKPIPCQGGMIVELASTAGGGVTTLTIDYVPWTLGRFRKKISDRAMSPLAQDLPVL